MRYTKIVMFVLVVVMVATLVVSMARFRPSPSASPAATPAGGSTPAAVEGYLTYSDEANGFIISYPEEWVPIPEEWHTEEVVGGFKAESGCGGVISNFRVGTREEPSVVTLEQYCESLREDYAAVEGCTFVAEEAMTVAGTEAMAQVFTLAEDEVTVKREQVILVRGTRVWFIVCDAASSCWSAYEPAFDTVVDSLHLLW